MEEDAPRGETKPLKDFKELLAWSGAPPRRPTPAPLASRSHVTFKSAKFDDLTLEDAIKAPRTLICHDMHGGYHEDRFDSEIICANEPYVFEQWSVADAFIYFSHHFVTIPPLGWISAGHKHGVPVLGTLITEWDAGANVWREILSSEENRNAFVEQCVKVALDMGFDGWLLNVENEIDEEKVPLLIEVVKVS